jgi:hypothetical protein
VIKPFAGTGRVTPRVGIAVAEDRFHAIPLFDEKIKTQKNPAKAGFIPLCKR